VHSQEEGVPRLPARRVGSAAACRKAAADPEWRAQWHAQAQCLFRDVRT